MTYKEAVSLFKIRYRRFAESGNYELQDGEILAEISAVQSFLQSKYYLSTKSSASNSTPQTTLIAGTAVYTAGTGANNIPNDILQILEIHLSDNMQTCLIAGGLNDLRNTTKITAKPSGYVYYKQNTTATIELDTYPDAAYTMTMIYVPRYDIYAGSGGSNTTDWSDLDYTAAGFGGSLKLPAEWDNMIISGAIANTLNNINMKREWFMEIEELIKSRPLHTSGTIPYNNADIVEVGFGVTYEVGQDYPRN